LLFRKRYYYRPINKIEGVDMGYLSEEQVQKIGFKSIGKNVMISDKACIYSAHKISIGDNSRIDDFCIISGAISIGRYVHMAVYSYLSGCEKGVIMEDYSGVAYGVKVFVDSDDYSGESMTNPTIPEIYKPKKQSKQVVIKKHAIVGANSLIMPGVILNEGTAVGANSMVVKSTDPWSVYFGNPAKKIKNRKKNILELERQLENDIVKVP